MEQDYLPGFEPEKKVVFTGSIEPMKPVERDEETATYWWQNY